MTETYAKPEGMQKYRAHSLFQPHRARQALRDAHEGKIPPLQGYYFGLSSPQYARVIAPMGFDMAWIDWEHSSCNVETMTDVCSSATFSFMFLLIDCIDGTHDFFYERRQDYSYRSVCSLISLLLYV